MYQRFDRLGQLLEEGFRALGEKYHRKLYLRHMGSIFVLYFGYTEDVADFRDWLGHADVAALRALRRRVRGTTASASPTCGAGSTSPPPTPRRTSARTLAVADQVLGEMAQEGVWTRRRRGTPNRYCETNPGNHAEKEWNHGVLCLDFFPGDGVQ